MKSKKQKVGNILMSIGAILIIGAMALFAYNEYSDIKAGNEAENVVLLISKEIATKTNHGSDIKNPDYEVSREEVSSFEEEIIPDMPVIEVDGHYYIGTISVPELSIELPVMDEWRDNYDDLKISPVRYSGSVYTNDMVIAGHNYRSHFNPLHNASVGMEVIFTDAYGTVYVYEIVELETIEPTDINGMIIFDSDLTLFTCTYGGAARHTVRCMRVN